MRGSPACGKNKLNAPEFIGKAFKYMHGYNNRVKINLAVDNHKVMVHYVTKGAFFLHNRLRCCFSNTVNLYAVFNNAVLMCIYHILARHKADQQYPGTDNMIFTFFQIYSC